MLKRFLFQSLTSFTGAAAALLLGAVIITLIVGGIISGFTGPSDDAIAYIAEKTGAGEDYSLQTYPEFHPSMMDMMMGGAVSAADLKMAFEKRDIALIETYFVKKLTACYPV